MSATQQSVRRSATQQSVRRSAAVTVGVVRLIGGWYWAIFVVVTAAIVLISYRLGAELDQGLLDSQMGGPSRWFMLVLGIIVPAAYLRLHVAAGGTRTAHVQGTVRGAFIGGALLGLATAVYLVGERTLYGSLGLAWAREFGPPVDGYAGIALTVVTEALVVTTYYLVGAAIAAGYYRMGAVRGTAYVVVTLVPAVLVDLATRTGVTALLVGPQNLPTGALGVLLGVVGGLGTAALAAWLFGTPLRSVPLRPAT